MRRLVLGILGVSLLCAGQQEVPTFRVGTTLIEFTMVALDSKGKPVTDLKQEEIHVTEQGHPRSLAFFRFEGEAETSVRHELPPHIFSNRAEYAVRPPRNVTAILFDALNTALEDQMSAREQVMEYLRGVTPGSRVVVYWLGAELRVVHNITGDSPSWREDLAARFKQLPVFVSPDVAEIDCLVFPNMATGPCGSVKISSADSAAYQALAERRKTKTLLALEALGDQLAAIPGRKSLIWIGNGIPIMSITGGFTIGDLHSGFKSYEAEIRKTAQRLATQGIVIYPVDAKGLIRGTVPAPVKRSIVNSIISNYMPESTNDVLANLTGGRVVKWTNQLSRGMEWAENDRRGSYTLGFYAGADPDNSWHNLSVKTLRRGVTLSYRQGFLAAAAAAPADWTEAEWRAAIANPAGSDAIRMNARFERVGEGGKHGLLLQVEAADLQFRPKDGRVAANVQIALADMTASGGFSFRVDTVPLPQTGNTARYAYSWTVAPGTSTVRLLLRDRTTGRFGTLDLPVK